MATVLIVDNNLGDRKKIGDILTAEGLNFVEVIDGLEALEKLPFIRPDLIILDVILPKMNGYEVCRKIKSNPETKKIPVLFCTSCKEQYERYWGLKQGADAYISKPFKTKEFIIIIRQLLKYPHFTLDL
ncbi:response regulator [Geminocystis sp. GBBB08]|uniref:response regulator n=1 Tax=Geminocystis sp. GBBB08 TaxID=2604140 RepID=UPI0027E3B19A|nr:response regulator [Geminocystis sp. GBBB08]MBL1210253.1 response regulator [Geminocystis sp. GBBB08]